MEVIIMLIEFRMHLAACISLPLSVSISEGLVLAALSTLCGREGKEVTLVKRRFEVWQKRNYVVSFNHATHKFKEGQVYGATDLS